MKNLMTICISFLLGTVALADGFALVDQGATGTGKAGMVAASVQDGSALFYNPARLATVRTADLEGTASILFPNLAYSTQSGNKYDGSRKILTPGSLFLTLPVTDRMTLGFGVTTPVMGDNAWGADFPGRFNASRYKMLVNTVSFGAGFSITPKIRLGFSADFSRADLTFENHFVAPYYDFIGGSETLLGFMEAKGTAGDTATAGGFTLGFSWDLTYKWSVSVTYRTGTEFDFDKLPVAYTQLGAVDVPNAVESFNRQFGEENMLTTAYDMPDNWQVGVSYRPSNRWIIEMDYARYLFSDARPLFFDYDSNTTSVVDRGMTEPWQDMDVFGFSLEYQASKEIRLFGGMRYASDTIPLSDMNPVDPSTEKFWISLGMSYLEKGNGWSLALLFKTYRDQTVYGQEFVLDPLDPGYLTTLDTPGLYDQHAVGFSVSWHHRF